MSNNHLNYRSIGRTLVWRIVLLAGLCLLLTATLHTAWAHYTAQKNFASTAQFAQNSVYALSETLTGTELAAAPLQQQVNELSRLPGISWVRLELASGQTFQAGALPQGTPPEAILPEITAIDHKSTAGRVQIGPDQSYYRQQIMREVALVTLDYAALTLLMGLLVGWTLRHQVEQPLQHIARFAAALTHHQWAQPLVLQRSPSRHIDDIDLVVIGLQELQSGLRHHIHGLDDAIVQQARQIQEYSDKLAGLSLTDPLTDCYNLRHLEEALPAEIERTFRYHRRLSVVLVDIDHLTAINDQWGRAGADVVLRTLAQRLLQLVRGQVDWVVRYGNEDFLIVLPETDAEGAHHSAERLRLLIWQEPITIDTMAVSVTASFGVAQYARGDSMATLLERASQMLCAAKTQGRNRVLVAQTPPDQPMPPVASDIAPSTLCAVAAAAPKQPPSTPVP